MVTMRITFTNKIFIGQIILISFLICTNAFAYLDPGTGSIIIQAIVAFLAFALGFLSYWWKKVKETTRKILLFFKKKIKNNF